MSKIYNGIMGLVVGDALGVPFEFKKRDTFECVDMVGFGTYNQPPGTWSDDSSMTLATVDVISRFGLDYTAIMQGFHDWYFDSKYTPHGKVFDIGHATQAAIMRYHRDTPALLCGGRDVMDNGNGSLMRILPLAFVKHTKEDVWKLSGLTHAHAVSVVSCEIYLKIAERIVEGDNISDAIKACISDYEDKPRSEVKSTGYVVDTLDAALWCLTHSQSYSVCVLKAVNLGGDTDTIAAVAGGLAGLYYGVGGDKGIPERWIDLIAEKNWIKGICESLEKAVDNDKL